MIKVRTNKDGKDLFFSCENIVIHERFIELKNKNKETTVVIPIDRIIEFEEIEETKEDCNYIVLGVEIYSVEYIHLTIEKEKDILTIVLKFSFINEEFCDYLLRNKQKEISINLVKFERDFKKYILEVNKK